MRISGSGGSGVARSGGTTSVDASAACTAAETMNIGLLRNADAGSNMAASSPDFDPRPVRKVPGSRDYAVSGVRGRAR